jgi:hypothetical protein
MTIGFAGRLIAAILFLLTALGVQSRVNLLALGLFCWVVAEIV